MRLALLHALLPASRLERLPGPDREPPDQRRPDPPAGRRPVARAQPVAGVRGRLPPRPRLRPAPRGLAARADDRAVRRGPPEPHRGDGQRRGPARHAVVVPRARGRGRRAGAAAEPSAGPARPRPAAAASERRAAVVRLLRDGLGPRPGRGVAASARGGLRRFGPRAVGLAVGRDPAGVRRRRAAPRSRRPGRPPPRAGRSGGPRRGRARRGRGRLSAGRVRGWPNPARRSAARSSSCRPARRSRSGRGPAPTSPCRTCPAARATRTLVPGRGLFAPPERFDRARRPRPTSRGR